MTAAPEEIEWHPDGEDVPAWFFGALIAGLGVIALAIVVALAPLDIEPLPPTATVPHPIPVPCPTGGVRC